MSSNKADIDKAAKALSELDQATLDDKDKEAYQGYAETIAKLQQTTGEVKKVETPVQATPVVAEKATSEPVVETKQKKMAETKPETSDEFSDENMAKLRTEWAEFKKKLFTKDGKRRKNISPETLEKEKEYNAIDERWEEEKKRRDAVELEKHKEKTILRLREKGLEIGDTIKFDYGFGEETGKVNLDRNGDVLLNTASGNYSSIR